LSSSIAGDTRRSWDTAGAMTRGVYADLLDQAPRA